MKWSIIACLLLSCGQQRLINSNNSQYYLGISITEEIYFVSGEVRYSGRDFVAYGKYKIGNLFNLNKFVSRCKLVESNSGKSPFFPDQSSKVSWFVICSEMKRFELLDLTGQSSLIVWIDDPKGFIFVENAKW